jgi:hypothetical protein
MVYDRCRVIGRLVHLIWRNTESVLRMNTWASKEYTSPCDGVSSIRKPACAQIALT